MSWYSIFLAMAQMESWTCSIACAKTSLPLFVE